MTEAVYYKGDFMLKRIFTILFILLLSIVFVGSLAFAEDKGSGQSSERPAGWDKGKKEGWQSDVPPGQEVKNKNSGKEEKLEEKQKEKKEKMEKGEKKKKKGKRSKKK